MPTIVEDIYRSAQRRGLTDQVVQWGALANIAQYRLPFREALGRLSPRDTVLDWGCGNGHFSYFLTQHGIRTVGLAFEDPPSMLASEPLFQHVRHDDPVTLPFENAAFDAAASVGVLEHSRVLKPGGTLLVFHLPNRYSWIECVVRSVNPWLRSPVFQHSKLFTRADVEQFLPPDLSIVECGRYNIIPRNPTSALPAWLRDSPTFVAGLNLLDDALTALLPVFAQNWFFVLRKR
jgi:SAM-dependent methyltransferase